MKSEQSTVFVGARIKHVKIQHLGLRTYIPEALHVILDRSRTDRAIANRWTQDILSKGHLGPLASPVWSSTYGTLDVMVHDAFPPFPSTKKKQRGYIGFVAESITNRPPVLNLLRE